MVSTPPDYRLLDAFGAGAIFFPRSDPRPPPPGASDVAIEVAPGVRVGARFYAHDAARPTFLYFHGNGEVASDHDDIAPLYHAIGVNLFVAEFRGYGRSDGQPSFADLVADAHPVAAEFHRILDAAGFAEARFLMGRSLGSHPALELAARRPPRFRGIVVESGAAGLGRLLERFGVPAGREAEALVAAHDAKLRRIRLPCLIIHGAADELVPLAQAERLHALLDEARREDPRDHDDHAPPPPPELLVVPGAGHNDLLWVGRAAYFDAIARLVAQIGSQVK